MLISKQLEESTNMDLKSILQYTHNLSILYIEDDLDAREQVRSILENLFQVVDTANDGKMGLEFYNNYYLKHKKYYDLILSDIEIPHISGIKLSEAILQINPNQHIIIISAYHDKEKLEELLTLGVDSFLHKPIEFKTFFETFKKCAKPIFEQKNILQTLEHVKEINTNLETVMDIINQVAIVSKTDLEGNITYVNDIFCKTSQYTQEELIGQNHNILRHKDMPSIVYKHLWEEITTGKTWKGKMKNKTKNGEAFYVNANIFPLYSHSGVIKEYIAIRFLTTEEEVKNREFKKKVLEQYQESKRRDFRSRKIITDLKAKLIKYDNFNLIEYSLKKEKTRSSKCNAQLIFTEDTHKKLEEDFEKYKQNIKKNISGIVKKNKELTTKHEFDLKKIEGLEEKIKSREDEFKRMNQNNELRAREIEDLRDVISHLENNENS